VLCFTRKEHMYSLRIVCLSQRCPSARKLQNIISPLVEIDKMVVARSSSSIHSCRNIVYVLRFTVFSKRSLSTSYPHQTLYTPPFTLNRATCPAHLIFLDLITRIIWGEQYRSLSSSLCSFLYSPDTSSLLSPNILLSTHIY